METKKRDVFASCHNHSTFSDGVYTPEELVRLSKEIGHGGLILTDHDTVRGTYFLGRAARKVGILTLLGCEFSTVGFGSSFHLVGFDFNPEHPEMKELLRRVAKKATERTRILMERGQARGTLPAGFSWEDVLEAYPFNDYYCNNQVFEVMLKKGLYRYEDYNTFFRENYAPSREESREIEQITGIPTPDVCEVVRIVRAAGGVPVVAHPHNRQKYVDALVECGVMGFEVRHPDLTEEECAYFHDLCEARGLYKLGGTDHSSILGGYMELMERHRLPPSSGYITEEEFMTLYRRELG